MCIRDRDKRDTLNNDMESDAVVIGAGLAGILTAYKLASSGVDTVVLEAGRIAGGQTKNTTAKITSQHGYIYNILIENFGYDKALLYAEANENAINDFMQIIKDKNIECDFDKKDAYIYSTENEELIKKEYSAAKSLGLPAELRKDTELPFSVRAAEIFTNQAQFNPLKFIKAIADNLKIYENTKVIKIEGNVIYTEKNKVRARNIIISTHYPFINMPGYYFMRLHQERSYVLALKNAVQLNGMYLGIDGKGLSFRNYKDMLLLGGANHRTGENSKGGRYEYLRKEAIKYYPGSSEVTHWSAQDCISSDCVPYIGLYSANSPNWYVCTGFMKWGMTSSMVCANIISDCILKNNNKYLELFSPQRFNSSSVPMLIKNGIEAVKGIAREHFTIPDKDLEELPVGHGGIVESDGEELGVYKPNDTEIHFVDTKCPHMGCRLEWNPDEKSWDCPCHGSRFSYDGKLIDNPSQININHETLQNREGRE